jgi:DNA-directed RNA polymerase specialized sigma24 family protein
VTRTPIVGRSSRGPRLAAGLSSRRALKASLEALPEPWRRIVILRDVDGRPADEVSDATGLKQRDVLNRARELLPEDFGRSLRRI